MCILCQFDYSCVEDICIFLMHTPKLSTRYKLPVVQCVYKIILCAPSLEYHDIVLVSKENDKFPCHKSILAARSGEHSMHMCLSMLLYSNVCTICTVFVTLTFS